MSKFITTLLHISVTFHYHARLIPSACGLPRVIFAGLAVAVTSTPTLDNLMAGKIGFQLDWDIGMSGSFSHCVIHLSMFNSINDGISAC